MTVSCQRLPKSTVVLTITIPWSEVKKSYEQVIETAVKEVKIKGFREGKAPKKIAQKHLDKIKFCLKSMPRLSKSTN